MQIHKGQFGRQDALAEIIKALVLKEISNELYELELETVELDIGTFDNCRESGYTYSIVGSKQDNVFCVYEHRNSDEICINGCAREDVKPYGPYSGETRWDVLFKAGYEDYHPVAQQLAEWLIESYKGEFLQSRFKPNPM